MRATLGNAERVETLVIRHLERAKIWDRVSQRLKGRGSAVKPCQIMLLRYANQLQQIARGKRVEQERRLQKSLVHEVPFGYAVQ